MVFLKSWSLTIKTPKEISEMGIATAAYAHGEWGVAPEAKRVPEY